MTSSLRNSIWLCSSLAEDIKPLIENFIPQMSVQIVAEQTVKSSSSYPPFVISDSDVFASKEVLYKQFNGLEFVQSTSAGQDPLIRTVTEVGATPQLKLCRLATPIFGQLMAEYAMAQVINAERSNYQIFENQGQKRWDDGQQFVSYRSLRELNVGILGIGELGRAMAKAFKAFDCTVWGLVRNIPEGDRRSKNVDHYYRHEDLGKLLQNCDYLCCVLPNTPDTTGILDGEILRACAERKPTLINTGRGNIISDDELIKALDNEWLSGAVLDVFHEEPLPQDSPLWTHKKVIITPHVSGISRPSEIAECFKQNYERFCKGEPLSNLVNWNDKY